GCEPVAETCVPLPVSDGAWLAGDGPQRATLVVEAWLETAKSGRRTERLVLPLAGQLLGGAS
ncbi:MAG TPA: hypothetical protein VM582_06870, partial [Candidatus Thermoplasmatota archaeon]|nr:hypothetical protein [Candidatus Thermoplasmatota archaeon]